MNGEQRGLPEHLALGDLLAIRDGEGSAAGRQHLESCPSCRAELERLDQVASQLRALPALRPPRDRWPVVEARVIAERRRRRWLAAGWLSLGAAAAVALVIGWRTLGGGPTGPGAGVPAGRLDSLVVESQRLEEALRALDPTGRVLSGRAASAVAQLEDGIALLDAQLTDAQQRGGRPEELVALWRQRVALMNQLLHVHLTRAAYVGL